MLKVRIIPTLLWKKVGLVKGVSFDSSRRIGPAIPAVKVFNQRDVDEIFFLDIDLNIDNGKPDYDLIREVSEECFVPLTVGGGISELDQVQDLLNIGADKISLNSICYEKPELVDLISAKHGNQVITGSVDVRGSSRGGWKCFSHSGRRSTGKDVLSWCKELEARGAGEILITSIDRDGTFLGYDLALIELLTSKLRIPVVASGGAGNYEHMIDAVIKAGASAVAASSIFLFTEMTPRGARNAMKDSGIPVRGLIGRG